MNGDVLTSHCFAEGLLRQIPEAVVTVLRSACAAVATTTHLSADNVSITHCVVEGFSKQSLQGAVVTGHSSVVTVVCTTANGDVLTSHCFAEGLLRQIPEAFVTTSQCACATTAHLPVDDVSITHFIAEGFSKQSLQGAEMVLLFVEYALITHCLAEGFSKRNLAKLTPAPAIDTFSHAAVLLRQMMH